MTPIPTSPILIPGYAQLTNTQSIVRLAGDGNYSLLYLQQEPKPLLVSVTLKWFECRFAHFIRVSKSALVNPRYVVEVKRRGPREVYLELVDGTLVVVSRRRIAATLHRLQDGFEPARPPT